MKTIEIKFVMQQILIAIFAVIVASILRKYLLNSLENKVVWITYYPAVMAAALFGGFSSGILTAIFTSILAVYGWPFFTSLPFINTRADWIGLFVFLLNCSMVSAIAEYSRRQRKRAQKAQEVSELANRSKSIFLANMSHELRTPLNAILGFTSLMKLNPQTPDDEQKNLDIINRSGEHLLNLINNVLDISKIESGQTEIENATFNIKNAIKDITMLMKQRAEANGLMLNTSIDESLPDYIVSDEMKIKQILINLLGNAIKFTNAGKIGLIVYTHQATSADKTNLILEITDTGIGISENDLNKIFEPFVQIPTLIATKGTGLGLTICKQFTELMGGKISVESKPGIGSTFKVQIPVNLSEEIVDKKSKYQSIKSIVPEQSQFRILVVEDQLENWILLQRILENVGLQVKVAENGSDGVELFKLWKPHLIFMDIRMPVMDGIEATQKIRELENGKTVIIVGVSAHVFKNEIQYYLSNGMDDFIKKPYHFNDIYGCLEKNLNIKYIYYNSLNDELQEEHMPISVDLLQRLDKSILDDLKESLENLDTKNLEILVEKISFSDKELSKIIYYYVSNLKYTELYKCISKIYEMANN